VKRQFQPGGSDSVSLFEEDIYFSKMGALKSMSASGVCFAYPESWAEEEDH
jgi:hypothetical protein